MAMNRAVNFDYHLMTQANKIHDKRTNWVLSSEFEAKHTAGTEIIPKDLFGERGKISQVGRIKLRHTCPF